MGARDILFVGVVLGGLWVVGSIPIRPGDRAEPRGAREATASAAPREEVRPVVARVDAALRCEWARRGLESAPPAPDLAVLRRLSLALTGSIPSLEEIRRFETDPSPKRLDDWLETLLSDRRTADTLAERLARPLVGTEEGPFLVFRRRRFTAWLGDAIREDRPYDEVVRDLIADHGLWTDHPATNFLSAAFDEESGRPDPERIASRVARAFLGVRLDCARCHDHPFEPWTQGDFRGLAAFFGSLDLNLRGVHDADAGEAYRPPDPKTGAPTEVQPRVPFRPELCPATGSPRERLAAWAVDPKNPHLSRATANRVWGVLFGRPLVEPVDDLPEDGLPPALELLAADFAGHGYRLHRLIRAIASTETFRLDSASGPCAEVECPGGVSPASGPSETHDESWAAFPMTRLRPDQIAGAVVQSAMLTPIDARSPWPVRLVAYGRRNDFVVRFGDAGADEFDERAGTLPQRLLLMNGDLVRETTEGGLFNAAARIALLAPDDRKAVEAAYLAVLTRRPTSAEAEHFAARLKGTTGDVRKEALADLFWTLLNATEFSWNH